jgi:hypothetical protein
MTQKAMVQPLNGMYQYMRIKLTVNKEEIVMGKEKRLEKRKE